jgi:hypothetical protein
MHGTNFLTGMEMGLNSVISEFGRVFGEHIPEKNRDEVVKAAALSWLSEQLTSAVQAKVHFTEAQPIEQANNCVRMGYSGLIHRLGGKNHICLPSILREQNIGEE